MLKGKSKKKRGNASKSVLSDPKQYLSFFAAFLIIQTIFWTLLITTGVNNKTSDSILKEEFKYHFVVNGISEQSYAGLQNIERVAKINSRLTWPTVEYLGYESDGFGTRSYKIGVILNDDDPKRSHEDFWFTVRQNRLNISKESAEYTPLYTDNPVARMQNKRLYKTLTIVFAVLTVIFSALVNKFKAPKRDDGSGERIYRSTARDSMYVIAKRIFFTLMLISAAAALIFLILLLSIGNGTAYFFLYIALFLVCTLFLTELFNTRVNHYKFRYGIYMTFGAGFKKLYSTAVKELMTVSLLTLLPSLGLSSLICLLIYSPFSSVSFFIPMSAVTGVIILNLLVVFTATYIPIKKMALKLPAKLLAAEDNSNLASSPRRSFDLSRKSFPLSYEMRGMWRFRKYFIRLVAIAVSFSTVFLCGLYIAHTNKKNSARDVHEFELSAQSYFSMSEEDFDNIVYTVSENKTFDYFFWKDSIYASSLKVHALLKDENVERNKYVYNIEGNSKKRDEWLSAGYSNTTDSFEFVAYNKTLLDTITEKDIYNIEGDIYSILDSDNTVIVSEYISNLLNFDFKVGDSIILAIPDEFAIDYDWDLIGTGKREQALEEMIDQSGFEYKEYKIGAIIDYGGADGNFIVGMNTDAYTALNVGIDNSVTPSFMKNILVYTKDGASSEDLSVLFELLKEEFSSHSYKVTETYNVIRSKLSLVGGHHSIILTISFLIMLISPLIWFFSQLRFYTRRNKEMFILKALGATERRIMKLYLVSGIILAVLSAVVTLAMSYLADYIIYLFCTWLVPSMSSISGVTVSFYMPPAALIICILTSVVCGFLSSYLPFVLKRFMRSKSDRYTIDGQ